MNINEFPMSENMQQCPCCDFFSLAERGKCLVCPVCLWEDDCESPDSPKWDVLSDLNDDFTLLTARNNFKKFGAWKPEFASVVISAKERESLKYEPRNV
jgi:hypothetical protein